MYEPLCQKIQRRIAVADDGIQFFFKACLHYLRQRIAINFVRALFRHAAQFFVCPFKRRSIGSFFRKKRLEPVARISDCVRICDDNFKSLFFPQIRKLLEHLVRGLKIQRRLLLRILEIPCAHQDGAVDRVLRVQEMHIPRCNDGDSELISKRNDLSVQIA